MALRFAPRRTTCVKTHTSYLTFNTKKRHEIIDITEEVEKCRAAAGIKEGMVLVSAMHISASIFVNDHEPGLWKDILDWLENRIAPWSPDDYRHNSGTGEDNAAAHLRSLTIGHEVIVPVTNGKLDFGPWQRVAKRLDHGAAAATERDPRFPLWRDLPLALRNRNRITVVIHERDVAVHAVRTILADLDRDVCHSAA